MGVSLVTGGTGFLGSAIARALCERGDDVRVTVVPGESAELLADLDVDVHVADVLDRRAVRRAVKGAARVFHAAGINSLRRPAAEVFRCNVDGTRNVLEEARAAGVGRVVHTSSIGAIGPAVRGSTADEDHVFRAGHLRIPYLSSKREAENVCLREVAHGLDVVIVNPGYVMGRGDTHRSSTELVRRFLRRELPFYLDGALNVVDVLDVARGHVLADERGETGERYILGGRNFTLDRLFADLGRLSDVEPPALKLPLQAALPMARAASLVPGRPVVTPAEVIALSQWWTYRSTKAKRELDWSARPHEETLEETIAWYREREPEHLAKPGTRQMLPLRVAGFGVRRAAQTVNMLRP